MTGQLWNSDFIVNHCEPSTNANLRLFEKPDHADVLVLYTEERESNGATRPRAYFLQANEYRVESLKRPHFVNTNSLRLLESIPVRPATPPPSKSTAVVWAQLAEDGRSFTLIRDGKELGPYRLPTYPSKSSQIERFLLTPATVVVDGTVAGIVVGAVAAYIYAAGRAGASQ